MYTVSVNLISYVLYDQLPECEETETINPNSTDPNATTEERTFIHWCEVEQTKTQMLQPAKQKLRVVF